MGLVLGQQDLGEQTVNEHVQDLLASAIMASRATDARDFINRKIGTVREHINLYAPPDPNDPNDQSRKKNIGERMKKHLEVARNKLKRLKGKTQQRAEEAISRAEDELDRWIKGGEINPPSP